MILADLCVRRPVFATMFVGVLVVLGWFSYKRLGVDLYPKVDMPMVMVQTYSARRRAGRNRGARHQAARRSHQHCYRHR